MKMKSIPLSAILLLTGSSPLWGTLVSINVTNTGPTSQITTNPPDPITPNPNDGVLLGWDEMQNVTLTSNLTVDRVFDPLAPFVIDNGNGTYDLAAGTVVSSHYPQWDPGNSSGNTVEATISLDSQVFAFITSDSLLFGSDATLGLPGLDYADFSNRGLESGDTTVFNGPDVDIDWRATSPGDWTRLITAYSPGGDPDPSVPEPSAIGLMGVTLLFAMLGLRRRR